MDALPEIAGPYYAQSYAALLKVGNYETVLRDRLAYISTHLPPLLPPVGSNVRVLSIGTGRGDFDILLLKQILLPHTPHISYDGIEPNSDQLQKFSEAIGQAKLDNIIKVHHATLEEYPKPSEPSQLYDFVVFGHVLYHLPVDALQYVIKNFLPPGQGTLLVLHNCPAGTSAIPRALGIPSACSVLVADALNVVRQESASAKINVSYIDRWIELPPECFQKQSREAIDLLSFFVHKDLRTVGFDIVDKIRDQVDMSKVVLKNGQKLLWSPECVAIIRNT